MTRIFTQLPEHVAVPAVNGGGRVRSASDSVRAPPLLAPTETGVAFGPVEIQVPPGELVSLNRMAFLPGRDDDNGGILFLSAGAAGGAVAAPESEHDPDTTRRTVLGAFAAIVATSALAGQVTADEDDETVALRVAEFELEPLDTPVRVRVLDLLDDVLPPTSEILVDQRSTRVGTVAEVGEGVTLRQSGGEVRVYIRDSRGNLAQLLAWAKSFIPSDESITYRRPFPNGRSADEYAEDEFVRLTSSPPITETIRNAGPDRTVFEIDGTTIPHESEGSNDRGAWLLIDNELVYEAGPDPPPGEEWQVITRLSALGALLN